MKILNITAQKPDSTGSGVYLANMVKAFIRAGHEQAVIAGIGVDDNPQFSEEVIFRPVVFESEDVPFPVAGMSDTMPYPSTRYCDMTPEMVAQFEQTFTRAIDEVLESFDPDIVICHHLYLLTSIVREKLADHKVVAICHSTDIRQMNKHTLARERILRAIPELDAIFALHDEQKQEIQEVYQIPEEKIFVLGVGFDSEIFYKAKDHDEDVADNSDRADAAGDSDAVGADRGSDVADNSENAREINALFVGKVCVKKGVESLIKALDLISTKQLKVNIRLAGGYNDPDEYERLVEDAHKCSHTGEFLGCIEPRELADEYRNADIFVLPSFFEGLPLVVIEALACGCKAIVTDLPGIKAWLEAQAPGAPVVFVKPPRMKNIDEAFPEDLPAFEARLAEAIRELASMPSSEVTSVSHLSWAALCERLLGYLDHSGKDFV